MRPRLRRRLRLRLMHRLRLRLMHRPRLRLRLRIRRRLWFKLMLSGIRGGGGAKTGLGPRRLWEYC